MTLGYISLWIWDLWLLVENVRTHKPHAVAWLVVCAVVISLIGVAQALVLASIGEIDREIAWRRALAKEREQ